ncbi:cutinase family protein [Mycolicibacterium phlei]|uniref:Cutinase n=1 Tax=Mycolicibacterium phlei DSM 43239 = CCUG 21000 TaxID=1226750 RepID=A0A5N5URW2_MYCPH|nr:cutinase family protein [Mycolicibacterium phlei]KAB7751857.1 cutinase [Mycolicibacterium phlei DSM 43239 = CCUG 21000]KXW60445.1 cutinase [Mycolicibacterium phlei DSM 43239 = CCUG 21000]KXW76864.1 cutinase [Mycolicibacterium phlei DSM 43071]
MRLRVLVSAVTAAAACVLPFLSTPAAAAQECSDVVVVFARGTGEPPGIGRVGQSLVDALRPQIGGRTLTAYGVNYPASYDFTLATDGAADASAFIDNLSRNCPNSRVVLGGFSQGAAVVDMLAGVPPLGDGLGTIGQPLPAGLAQKVAAVAAFGNPAAKFGKPITSSPMFAGRAIDLCTNGDPICSPGRNPFAHSDYHAMAVAAANFVAPLL